MTGRHRNSPLRWPASFALSLAALVVSPTTAGLIPVDGTCSLADAIAAANSDAAVGGCPAGSGADTLTLGGDVSLVAAAVSDPTFGDTGLPAVVSDITIEGDNNMIERAPGAPPFRIFWVKIGGSLTLREMAIRNGNAMGDPFLGDGGAILVGEDTPGEPTPTLTLENSTVSGNEAAGFGGGIAVNIGVLNIQRGVISSNSADNGGGLALQFTSGSIADTSISSNTSRFGGGGLISSLSLVDLARSTISNNTALEGGGYWGQESVISFTANSTISGNAAVGNGGGVFLDTGPGAGQFRFEQTTIMGNGANDGSGVYFTIFDGGSATFVGSIIADNTGPGSDCGGTDPITDGGGNFASDDSCGPGFALIVPGADIDPLLAANGGPTLTHALLSGSPAIDAAGSCGLATDQRGVARADGACDSGAFEFGEPLLVVMTSMSATSTAEGIILRWTTASEVDTAGFRILRSTRSARVKVAAHSGDAVPVSDFIPAAGNPLGGTDYEWVDRSRRDPRAVRYWVEEIDSFGRTTRHGPVFPSSVRGIISVP